MTSAERTRLSVSASASASAFAPRHAVQQVHHAIVKQQRVLVLLHAVGAALASVVMWQLWQVLWPTAGAHGWWSIAIAGLVALIVLALRGRSAYERMPLSRVALWMEEQGQGAPSHALVTLMDVESPDASLEQAAARVLAQLPIADALTKRRWRLWRGPVLFVCGTLVLLMMPNGMGQSSEARLAAGAAASGSAGRAGDATSAVPLGRWRVVVSPPAYTGRATSTYDDVASVQALSGSRVLVSGAGDSPYAVVETVGEAVGGADSAASMARPLSVSRATGEWHLQVVAHERVQALRVSRGGTSRLLIVEGVRDSIPLVRLEQPARDSVFRTAVGELPLRARAHDDIGVSRASFEVVITSGEGERFTVRTLTLAAQQYSSGTRDATWQGTFNLASHELQPGDVVHVRAVARDAHPQADREFGTSETRAFRIARPAEYDSVAVEPAPPPAVDSSLLSQRMVLMLTQKLDARRRALTRAEVVRESLRLAKDQARLRLAVGDVVFQRLSGESSAEHAHYAGDGHDHGVDASGGKLTMGANSSSGMLEEGNDSPIVAINKPLLEAYNAMWDAGRALEQGDPRGAIPAMERALEAIERSRAASRLYLRGRPPQVIVDLAKVRLTGKDTGQSLPRSARTALARRDAARDARLVRAIVASTEQATASRDSLALLRAESLADAPAFAAALARVLDQMAQGTDITAAVLDARRVLGNVRRTTGAAWGSGGTP